jgi:hypothetical protein
MLVIGGYSDLGVLLVTFCFERCMGLENGVASLWG